MTRLESILFQVIDVEFRETKKDPIYKLGTNDPTLDPEVSYPCNFFVNDFDKNMPKIKEGSIVLLKNAKIQGFGGKPQLCKDGLTSFILYTRSGEPYYTSRHFKKEAGNDEVIKAFLNWSQAAESRNNSLAKALIERRRPIITTCRILEDKVAYFNYVGMIVGFFEAKGDPLRREIKVTDYTRNPQPLDRTNMADDGTIRNITNDMTLLCTLYVKHAECGPFEFGDYVFLDNCQTNENNPLQLEIRVSYRENDSVHVIKLKENDERLQPLLRRKEEYEASLNQSASQIPETTVRPMRSRIPGQKTLVRIKQLLEKEEPGVEYIRVTIENMKPTKPTNWLKNYCVQCKITSVLTSSEGSGTCYKCGNIMNPVYRAMFKVKDESGYELAVLVIDEEADKLFKDLPAQRLKENPALWEEFKKYIIYMQDNSNGSKPYFSLGVRKYHNSNTNHQDGWMYSIVNTEFIIEDGSQ